MESLRPDRSRNEFRGRRDVAFRIYVALVAAAGLVLVGVAWTSLEAETYRRIEATFWVACVMLLVAELRPLFTAGARDSNGHVLSTTFVFAILLRYGLDVALVVQALAVVVSDVSRGRAPWRIGFNVGQYSLSWGAAWIVMGAMGLRPGAAGLSDLVAGDLMAAVAGGLGYFVANQALVTTAVSLHTGLSVPSLLKKDLAYEAVTDGALLALAPLVVLALEEGVVFLPLLLPPLVAVYKVASIALEREHQALTDALTGLPNRKSFTRRTTQALQEHGCSALLLFDLDRFKEVNDTLGHHVGDRLLQVAASRLAGAVREGDTVARLGGDEFAVLLPGMGAVEAEEAARRLLDALSAPLELEGLLVDVWASVGVAVSPYDGTDLDVLLQHADVAMYVAKDNGGGVELYDPGKDRNSTGRLVMLSELRRAISGGELEVHYQPKADLRTGTVDGVEALVRWRHAERGLIPPDEFIPLAERSGLIESLTLYVVDDAVAQLALWRQQGLRLTVAINISVRDLAGGRLTTTVAAALATHDVPASCLQLEMTEGSLFSESHRAASTLRHLDVLGVALSLDDFGTGYSSLEHLRRLPVQEIKIDRSFVSRMATDPRDCAIVRSVIDLASGLGMHVVAEGVEDRRTWELLREMGCDSAQGWFLSAAEPAQVLTPWLLARQSVTERALR